MAPPHKTGPAAPPAVETVDVLSVLVARQTLSPEQAERARRSAKMNTLAPDQAAIQLGLVNEIQIARPFQKSRRALAVNDHPKVLRLA